MGEKYDGKIQSELRLKTQLMKRGFYAENWIFKALKVQKKKKNQK